MKWYLKVYKWLKERSWAVWYNKLKLWLRETALGRSIDRFVRLFVLTAIVAFVSNWAVGQAILPVLQTSIGVAVLATLDKIKNEILSKARKNLDEAENGITRT